MTRSPEYQALEVLGPGVDGPGWDVRLALARILIEREIAPLADQPVPLDPQTDDERWARSGHIQDAYLCDVRNRAQAAIPTTCKIVVNIEERLCDNALQIALCCDYNLWRRGRPANS